MIKPIKMFKNDENGTVLFFTVIMFVVTIAAMGFAIDVARFEARRAIAQTQLDNAALAAASLRQGVDVAPSAVVSNFMQTVDIENSQTVDETYNVTYRYVDAKADIEVDTFFMRMFGLNSLAAEVTTSAKERVPQVELSLVLDISGSMAYNTGSYDDAGNPITKIGAMQTAAQEFVDQMLAGNDEENPTRISISLIPYNMQVNAGSALYQSLTTEVDHHHSYCAEFYSSAYSNTTWSDSQARQHIQMAYKNPSANYRRSYYYGWQDDFWEDAGIEVARCRQESFAQILPWSIDGDALKTQIANLQADGSTSIDIGAKWGALLLDPSLRGSLTELSGLWQVDPDTGEYVTQDVLDDDGLPVFNDDGSVRQELIATHRQAVDPGLAGRPVDYDDELTMKIMVIMSDGENTTEYRIKNSYRGNSNATRIYFRNVPDYELGEDDVRFGSSAPSGFVSKSWNETWAYTPLYHYMVGRYGRSYSSGYWWYSVGSWEKDGRLSSVCRAMKTTSSAGDNPVVIFSIAYDAPYDGQRALKDCATSDAFYHTADETNISEIFSEIGGVIEKLKLTK